MVGEKEGGLDLVGHTAGAAVSGFGAVERHCRDVPVDDIDDLLVGALLFGPGVQPSR
ncbi:hypothetical protein ACFWWB_39075 [Streptomyces sp. NPDC058690]|uniref:hypothetical protein n=1 Tax=Streptomyces sp. NPDC058690 TaxID=3346600 RepID=UPI003661CEC0